MLLGVFVLLRWRYYWGVCITEVAVLLGVFVLLRWRYYWGVYITEEAVLLGCLYY